MEQTATEFIRQIYNSGRVQTESGLDVPLHSAIDPEESEFIARLIQAHNCKTAIEIGCAYGLSSLRIAASVLSNSPEAKLTIIDPHQQTQWQNTGVANLRRAGFSHFELIEKPSEFALPALLEDGRQFDFAFIDGWHTFDHTLLDFFYLNRMLKTGGVLVFDDVTYPSVNRCIRYIRQYPCYRPAGTVEALYSVKRSVLMSVKRALSPLARLMPYRQHWFEQSLLMPDQSIGLKARMAAFVKTAEDERPFDWYSHF